MKKIYLLSILLLLGCKEQDYSNFENPINDFVWKGMNMYYNWQDKVPLLADKKANNLMEYEKFINSYDNPKDLFGKLLYQYKKVDRFSWYIEDYVAQEKSFQGIQTTYGFDPIAIKTASGIKMLLVSKVSKKSPASISGLKRGDIIIGANGVTNNWNTLVDAYYANSAEFIIGDKDGVTELKRLSIVQKEVSDDAIHLTKIFDVNGEKVGYFVYNGFRSSYDNALNNAFKEFKDQGITKLILDLRYNRGGSVLSSNYLASLIYGKGTDTDIFAITKWNSKQTKSGYKLPFFDIILNWDKAKGEYVEGAKLNRVNTINKLYVLTTESTASASEMVINGLKPYMDVVTIGTKTTGKNVGSITLYDSPSTNYESKKGVNKNHTIALQPITFQIYNYLGQSDYGSGFIPDIEVDELKNLDGYLAFGDENETLLKTALNDIKGISPRPNFLQNKSNISRGEGLHEPSLANEMYFEEHFEKVLKE